MRQGLSTIVSFLQMRADHINQLKDMIKREVLRRKKAPTKRNKRLSSKAQGVLYKISSSKSITANHGDFHAREIPNASSPLSIIQCFAVIVLSIIKKSHVLNGTSQSSLIPAAPESIKHLTIISRLYIYRCQAQAIPSCAR